MKPPMGPKRECLFWLLPTEKLPFPPVAPRGLNLAGSHPTMELEGQFLGGEVPPKLYCLRYEIRTVLA